MADFNAVQTCVFPLSPDDLHLKMQGDWNTTIKLIVGEVM